MDSVLGQPDAAPFALPDDELSVRLDEIFAAEQSLAARRLAIVAQIDTRGLAIRDGATSTAAWLRERLRIDPGPARQMVRLAQALDKGLPATAEALAEARVNEDQARAIDRAISDLPAEIGPALRAEAEEALIGYAAQFGPAHLGLLGSRVLQHIAPEIAERHEREQLERSEARAWRDRHFKLSPEGPGRMRLSGVLDTESAATISAALEPLCSPIGAKLTKSAGSEPSATEPSATEPSATRQNAAGQNAAGQSAKADSDGDGGGRDGDAEDKHADDKNDDDGNDDDKNDDRTPGQRRADALIHVCRMALAGGDGRLPSQGGQRPQVMVVMPYEPWRDATASAIGQLDNGQRVSPTTLRRMACDADLIPVVLGTDGLPLDVGRRHRLFPDPIRKALILRDGGCAFPDCDRPASWCECHHILSWEYGGSTSLDNGVPWECVMHDDFECPDGAGIPAGVQGCFWP